LSSPRTQPLLADDANDWKTLGPRIAGTLLETASDIRKLIGQHHDTYEVLPYYVVIDIQRKDAPTIYRKAQAGFDIDLYGTGVGKDLNLSSDGDQVSLTVRDLQEVAEAVKPHPT
jgi:hypothetical protein